jgi:hypothetical protein
MARWSEFEAEVPEFAERVRQSFEIGRHKIIATIRPDGSPRISGIESEFRDGDLTFGMMPESKKGADLMRNPRFALHSAPLPPAHGDEAAWQGEAKLAGKAILLPPEAAYGPEGEYFAADLSEVVFTGLNDAGTLLAVEWWTPGEGMRRIERA